MFCPKCGTRQDDDSRFCHKCGADLSEYIELDSTTEELEASEHQEVDENVEGRLETLDNTDTEETKQKEKTKSKKKETQENKVSAIAQCH